MPGSATVIVPARVALRAPWAAHRRARPGQYSYNRLDWYFPTPYAPAAFAALEAALTDELAPQGALQSVASGRIARAAWRLERAARLEVELFAERHVAGGGLGLALIRDGNGTRSFETRWREPAPTLVIGALRPTAVAARPWPSSGVRCARSRRSRPSRRSTPAPPWRRTPRSRAHPARGAATARPSCATARTRARFRAATGIRHARPTRGRTLHEHAAPWPPNEPETRRHVASTPGPRAASCRTNPAAATVGETTSGACRPALERSSRPGRHRGGASARAV